MADESTPPKSDVTYKKVSSTLDNSEEVYLSTESATDEGAWKLFMKLKKEMGVS